VACILAAAFALLATVSASAHAAAGAGARLEWIAAAGELRVGIWPEYYGVSFHHEPLLRERLKQSEFVDRFVAAIKADGRLAKAAERYGLEPIVVHE
jgi:ABC-type amino acid transport substrate-binding protein